MKIEEDELERHYRASFGVVRAQCPTTDWEKVIDLGWREFRRLVIGERSARATQQLPKGDYLIIGDHPQRIPRYLPEGGENPRFHAYLVLLAAENKGRWVTVSRIQSEIKVPLGRTGRNLAYYLCKKSRCHPLLERVTVPGSRYRFPEHVTWRLV